MTMRTIRLTIKVGAWKRLYDGESEEKVSRRNPARRYDVAEKIEIVKSYTGKKLLTDAHSRSSGMTTGPPPKIIVPAR
jgi:hypothetical protein